MTRRCCHCSNNGHNSRTCPARVGGVRLFGVRLTEGVGSMKKSASMGSLSTAAANYSSAAASPNPGSPSFDPLRDHAAAPGYASDDPNQTCRGERKKGTPWTEEEHRMFLVGLQKLGKGDWRGIARNFVVSRTPTQVASHAQKYFIRQTNASRRKRRSSLFDMVPEMTMDHLPVLEEQLMVYSPPGELENTNPLPSLHLCQDQGSEPAEPISSIPDGFKENSFNTTSVTMVPAFYPALIPVPFGFWPPTLATPAKELEGGKAHEVLKPTPVLPKDQVNVDAVVRMSKLSIDEGAGSRIEPSALSHKLLGASGSRQSAFHRSGLNQSSSNPIHAL